jgi:hypothetical protein
MRTRVGTILWLLTLVAAPSAGPLAARTTGPLFDDYGDDGGALEPPGPPPAEAPPPPPQAAPPRSAPPGAVAAPIQPAPAPRPAGTGQWVFTAQYGWVWMPYGETFTYLPPDGSTPSMYVYYPEAGWCWVVAPWLWGLGPRPHFVSGPGPYVWFGIGLGHWYGFAGPYRHWGWPGRAYWYGGGWHGVGRVYAGPGPGRWRPGPSRGGWAPRR